MATTWTEKTAQAALLVAQDQQTDESIAAAVGVKKITIERWKRRPDFRARVQVHVRELEDAIKGRGIAERVNRVQALDERWRKMQQVIDERAADEYAGAFLVTVDADGKTELHIAPGWTTGLMVRQEKVIGGGPKAQRVVEFAVDTGLLAELRAHEKQAAEELGQWVKRNEHTGKDGEPIQFEITDARARLQARLTELADRRRTGHALPPVEDGAA